MLKHKLIVVASIALVLSLGVAGVVAHRHYVAGATTQSQTDAKAAQKAEQDKEARDKTIISELNRISSECKKAGQGVKQLAPKAQPAYAPDCALRVL